MAFSPAQDTVRFGLFELDLKAGQLNRNGTKIRLAQQPLQLLSILLERPGEILTRDELRQRLWPSDVFVDFDHGLNKSVQKLRDALGDSADSPRYIETIPRVGYRFIAPVNGTAQPPAQQPTPPIPQTPQTPAAITTHPTRWLLLAACLILLATTAAWFLHKKLHPPEPIRSIAILPLDNLSGDPSQNYFADGMTDELTTMLAKDSTLRIVSRTSVMQYKGAHRPLPEIARELGVDGILEGSVERFGDNVHMTIQLIHAPTDTHIWAESYDRNANDIVSLPSEAAHTIAKQLHSAATQPTPQRYVNPEAHDDYLRGRYLWFLNKNEESGQYFKKATELQPDYALGWAGLSMYYGAGAVDNHLNPLEALPQAEAAAARAVELDDSLAEAHLTLGGSIFLNRWDWVRADQEFSRAIELNPNYAEPYNFRAKIYVALNRHQEAIESEKKAQELDPFQRPFAMALIYYSARQYDAAINDARLKLVARPDDFALHWTLCEAYRRKGDLKESMQELDKLLLSRHPTAAAEIRHAYEQGGYKAALRWRIADLTRRSSSRYLSPLDIAILYAQLGDREKTLALLEEGYRLRVPDILWIQNDPAYDFLHSDPRYRSIIQRIGLPPAW